jgi:hypothetical protein
MPISKRTKFIFDNFYIEKAKSKNRHIIRHYNEYYNNIDLPDEFEFSVCEVKVMEYVIAYYLDVIKYKESHFHSDIDYEKEPDKHLAEIHNKKINSHKVASFSAKWLLKDTPASIRYKKEYSPTDKEKRLVYTANEGCVLSYVAEILKIKIDSNQEIFGDILYHFKFRKFDHRHFILIFNLLEQMYK